MTNLDNAKRRLYNTYHSKKNKEALPITIFFGVIVIIFKNPLFWESLVWTIYYLYCFYNNTQLENNSKILEEREFLIGYIDKIEKGIYPIKELPR